VIALFGSGEFLPWARPVDQRLLGAAPPAAVPPRVLVVPTASAPEGDAVFERWAAMGLEHYRELGAEPEALPLKVRADAEEAGLVARVAGASLIYFSGGNPAYLVRCLKGTAFWAAVERAVMAGCGLGGASAGIAFLGARTFDPAAGRAGLRVSIEAMGFFPRAIFGPHWDAVDRWRPGATAAMLASVPPGHAFLGIEEDTAVIGDGARWEVYGRGSGTVVAPGGRPAIVRSGERFHLALRPPPATP
jgi:cyanophycinase